MTLVIPAVGTIHLAAYALRSDRFVMMSIDTVSSSAPMWSGTAFGQSGAPFSNASLQGTGVFDLLGQPVTVQVRTSAGLMTGDASCGLSGVLDSNVNGTVTDNASYTATCTIRADGRGTLTSTTLPALEFYVVNPGRALLMGTSGSAVDLGSLEPQAPMTCDASALVGQFAARSNPPPSQAQAVLIAAERFDTAGNIAWTADSVLATGLYTLPGTGTVGSAAANGRGVVNVADGSHVYFYMVSPMKFVEVQGYVTGQLIYDQNMLLKLMR